MHKSFPIFHNRFRKNQSVYALIGGGYLASGSYDEWVLVEQIVSAKMNPYTFQNDIALVKIPQVPQQIIMRATKKPAADSDCLIFGYGSSSYYASTVTSNVIRYARTNLISFERCEEIIGRVSAPMPGQFCAYGINGSDACFGEF